MYKNLTSDCVEVAEAEWRVSKSQHTHTIEMIVSLAMDVP